MSISRYLLPFSLLLLFLGACPVIYDPNAAAKGYLFFFFSFLGLLGLILAQRRLHLDPVVFPLVALVGVLFISSFSSRSPADGLIFVAAIVTAVACFLVNRQIVQNDKGAIIGLMAGVALIALLFASLGVGQFIARIVLAPTTGMYIPYILPKIPNFRVSGPFGQANFHALLMVVGLCAHGYIYLSANKVQVSRLVAWLFSLPVFLLSLNLFLTQSRAGKLSLVAVALGLMLWLRFWHRQGRRFPCTWRPLVTFGLLLVGAFLLVHILLSSSSPGLLHASRSSSIDNRINNWTAALLMAADHPLLGVGPDNYMNHLHPYQVQARNLLQFEYEDLLYTRWAHNEFLQLLAEGGILGLAAVLWFGVLVGRRLIRGLMSDDLPFERIFLSLALLPFLVHSLLEWPLRFAPLAALFFTLLAFSLDVNSCRWTLSLESRWRRGALICGILFFVSSGCWLFYSDWQVGILKERISDRSQLEANFKRFEKLAENPFTAREVLTRGVLPFVSFAMAEDDFRMSQQLIPYVQKGISLDGAHWQWYNLARLFLVAKDEAGARAAIRTCLDLNPIFEPGWGFLHYLNVLNVSKVTGKPVSELLPKRLTEQELLDIRHLSPPHQQGL